jgi:hypothetical protein
MTKAKVEFNQIAFTYSGYESGQSVHVLAKANAELQVNGANGPEHPHAE